MSGGKVIYYFIGFWHCRCYFCRKRSWKSCNMKPENAHLISLCWHLVLLVFFLGIQWSFFVQDSGRPKNKTQLWADHVKELDGAPRSEGKHAWPLCYIRWVSLTLLTQWPQASWEGLQNKTLWQHEGSSHCLCSDNLKGSAVSANEGIPGRQSTWNLVTQKTFFSGNLN